MESEYQSCVATKSNEKDILASKDASRLDNGSLVAEEGLLEQHIDRAKEIKLLAKLDVAFVPIIMVVYLSCFLDRSNIGEQAGSSSDPDECRNNDG